MRSIYLTEEHEQFRETVRQFFAKEAVNGAEWEKQGSLPREIWEKMGALGFLGINFPETYGGADADFFYSAVFLEELGRLGLGGFGAAVGVQQYMATAHIFKYGTEQLKERYLPASIQGKKVGALAISEPDVGSDVSRIRTRAVKTDDSYLVNGSKTFITNGCDGDFATVAVRTGEAGTAGISLLVIDQGTPGFSSQRLEKMGWHSGDTGELYFENVQVPITNLVGEEGMGFYYIMECFQLERLVAALTAIGGIEGAMNLGLDYIQVREAFGRSIARYQTIRHSFADLATELEACRHLTYHTCWLHDQNENAVKASTMSKLMATELGKKAADVCLQYFGGYGYMEEYPICRMYRDARVGTIVGGTSAIMREILAKILIDGVDYKAPTVKPALEEVQPTIAEIFGTLPSRYKPETEAKARYHFDFSEDGGGCFTIAIEAKSCTLQDKLEGEPDCLVSCPGSLYREIEQGKTSPEAAFMTGKIKISNLPMMMQFSRSFEKRSPN